jgi:hypothetical protein
LKKAPDSSKYTQQHIHIKIVSYGTCSSVSVLISSTS